MTEQQSIEARQKFVEAWNNTMVRIWQDRIIRLGVFENPRRPSREGQQHLLDSLEFFPVSHDGQYMEFTISHAFLEYGLYQDFGVGREKAIGNSGDIGLLQKSGKPRKIRERRKWFSPAYYASCMNIKDFMAESIGNDFKGILSDVLSKTEKYN